MLTTIRRKSHQTRVLTVRSCPGSDEDADTTYSLDQAERFKPKDGITYHRDGHAVLSAQHGCAWQPIAWPQRSITDLPSDVVDDRPGLRSGHVSRPPIGLQIGRLLSQAHYAS